MTAQDILAIVQAFFDAILRIFKALGINLGGKEETTAEDTTGAAE